MKASNNQIGGTHYKDMGDYQPWDVLQHWLTPEEYRGYQKGVAIAYLARERAKGGDQDLRKALHHLQKMVEVLDQQEADHAAHAPDSVALHMAGIDTLNAGPGIDVVSALAANSSDDRWIEWGGGECKPVDKDAIVKVMYRNGVVHDARKAFTLDWDHDGSPRDIVKWKPA